jgi:hypothetical protein
MSIKASFCLSSLSLFVAALVFASPAMAAADNPPDSKEVSALLSEAKTETIQLRDDADAMESFTLSNLSWQSHADKVMEIKQHINNLGKTIAKLNGARNSASPWQQVAIDRINPILRELAANVEATIDHLNRDRGNPLQTSEHKDFLKANAELSTRIATLVSDFVDYGQTKTKFEQLSQRLEVAER